MSDSILCASLVRRRTPCADSQRIRITDERDNYTAAERTKRLTVDLPESVHTRSKSICAAKQRNMVEIIREKIERYLREEAA